MQVSQFLKDLTERLSNVIPTHLQTAKQDFVKNAQGIVTAAFNRLEIVTREEFDAQTKVLARTRQKLAALEAQVSALEQQVSAPLDKNNGG